MTRNHDICRKSVKIVKLDFISCFLSIMIFSMGQCQPECVQDHGGYDWDIK